MTEHLEEQGPLTVELLYWMGRTLFTVQTAERCLKGALKYAGETDWESVRREGTATRKYTIGRLLNRLREKATIASDFDTVLTEFLAERNAFIHAFQDQFRIRTLDDTQQAIAFLQRLERCAGVVITVLQAAIMAWSKSLLGDLTPEVESGSLVARIMPTLDDHILRKV